MFEKILYIGAGLDLSPLDIFPETRKFVFVDSCPRTEFGYEYYYKPFYRPYFVEHLMNKMDEKDLTLISKEVLTNKYEEIQVNDLNSTLLYFSDKKRTLRSERCLKYYISTGIPIDLYGNQTLINDIKSSDTIYVSGHEPNNKFVQYLNKPFHFIGKSNTWYPQNMKNYLANDDTNCTGFFYYLLTNADKVCSYTFIDERTKKYWRYNTYAEFYKKYKELQKDD